MNYRSGSPCFNRLRFVFDRSLRMSNVTERIAAAFGDAEAFATEQPLSHLGCQSNVITFEQVHSIVGRLATVLLRAGLQRFERVAIYKQNSLDYFLMALAIMRAGGIAVPVHGRLSPANFKLYAEHTGCTMAYVDKSALEALSIDPPCCVRTWILPTANPCVPRNCLVLDEQLTATLPVSVPAAINRLDDALIAHTSGTTGFPKGVLHSSGSLIHSVRLGMIRNLDLFAHRALMAAHQNHHITFTCMLMSCLMGVPTFCATDHSPAALFALLQQRRISVFFGFPDIYLQLICAGLRNLDLPHIQIWLTGGDAMHEAHIRECVQMGRSLRVLGIPMRGSLFMELLGTSEVGSAALIKMSTVRTERYSRFVGKQSWLGAKVKVADEFGKPMLPGAPGRLMVQGPTLFKGYWNAHDRLHHVIVDGWWWTGDVARQDKRGNIYHLDREVDMVRTRKGNVFGLPIEEELLKCEDIGEAAVIGLPRAPDDIVPVGVVHSRSGASVDVENVLRIVNAVLPPDQRLATLIDVREATAIPRGLTGKVLKRELRERFAAWLLQPARSSQTQLREVPSHAYS